ncbi:MAG: hypothetical protein WBB85_03105 [Albidovulum sp.]|uniref:hypothetical protein n=1 Tax=Albidovulum sp. TaxID=1872424 RepID=UPI003CA3D426
MSASILIALGQEHVGGLVEEHHGTADTFGISAIRHSTYRVMTTWLGADVDVFPFTGLSGTRPNAVGAGQPSLELSEDMAASIVQNFEVFALDGCLVIESRPGGIWFVHPLGPRAFLGLARNIGGTTIYYAGVPSFNLGTFGPSTRPISGKRAN